jgi:ABC-type Fe3+/spermidine/putrescine transport system ATPase subunit
MHTRQGLPPRLASQAPLTQIGERDAVLDHPSTPEVARVVGMSNLVRGEVSSEGRGGLALVAVDEHHRIPVQTALPARTPVWLGIRPEHLKLDIGRGEIDPIGKATVRSIVNDGVAATVVLDWAGAELRTHLLARRGVWCAARRTGAPVSLSVRPEHLHLMPAPCGTGAVN